MKVFITITKQEIEQAVTKYLSERIDAGYGFTFEDVKLSFSNKDGDLAYFECRSETDIIAKEKS